MKKKAVIIGRFQPYHKGHHLAVRTLLSNYEQIVIVIGSADASMSSDNPFTVEERMEMIKSALTKEQFSRTRIIKMEDKGECGVWADSVIDSLDEFDALYSNNPRIISLFKRFGVDVKRIDHCCREHLEGKKIREMIKKGRKMWLSLLPAATTRYLLAIDAEKRMKKIKKR